MNKWLELIYKSKLESCGIDYKKAILFMDNCSAHDNEKTIQVITDAQLHCEFFPPKCTPHPTTTRSKCPSDDQPEIHNTVGEVVHGKGMQSTDSKR